MGKSNSKNSVNSENPQVQILNQLETHEELHLQHDLKLTVIAVIVILHLSITLYKLYKEQTKTQALKAAKSIASTYQQCLTL